MVVRRTLTNWGAEVTVVANGVECLNAVKESYFDLILMDVKMPVMDGYTATKMIRSSMDPRLSKIPIIAMTASVLDEIHERLEETGKNAYVSKPFNPKELLKCILDAMDPVPVLVDNASMHDAIDLSYLSDAAFGDLEFLRETILLTAQQIELLTGMLDAAYEQNEAGELYQAAHQMKPLYKMLAQKRASAEIEKIEAAVKDGLDTEHLGQSILFLRQEAVRVAGELKIAQAAPTQAETDEV